MANKTPVAPRWFDVSAEATQTAAAAISRWDLAVPEDARESTNKKTGDTLYRFQEQGVITSVESYASGDNNASIRIAVRAKVRPPSKNAHKYAKGSHFMAPPAPASLADDGDVDWGLVTVTALLQATGLMPNSGRLLGSFLSAMFPPAGIPGAKSALIGKTVTLNLVNRTTDWEGAKDGRETVIEGYLPAVVAAG